jgi:Zn-dependent peptidase ImmA (M78 family)
MDRGGQSQPPNDSPGNAGSVHMTVRWERFAGSTDTFAVRIAFMPDPDEGVASDPAEAASWGAVQFWVDGQNLCAHIDQGEVLQSAHWYLLPLLEWIAESWNPLLHEEVLPNSNIAETAAAALEATRNPPALVEEAEAISWDEERYEWWSRHSIRTARAGGLLPNVVFRRFRDLIEVSWNEEPLTGAPPGFRFSASSGSSVLLPEQVAQPMYDLATAAANYLYELAPGHERFTKLRNRLAGLTSPVEHGSRLEWLAGLRETPPLTGRLRGTASEREMHRRWEEIVAALNGAGNPDAAMAALAVEESPLVITGSCHAALMFSSMSPTVSENDVRTLARILVQQYSPEVDSFGIRTLSRTTSVDVGIRPWEQGYDLAESIHSDLTLDLSRGWVDIEAALTHLGVSIMSSKLDDRKVRACSLIGPRHVPSIVHNEASLYDSPGARRFTLAHELCHLLFDQSKGKKLAIASGPWAPRGLEQRANAFAAMFLMPPQLVARAVADLPDPVQDPQSISAIAARLQINRMPLIHHLYNLTLMSESERDELLRLIG